MNYGKWEQVKDEIAEYVGVYVGMGNSFFTINIINLTSLIIKGK